MTKSCWRRAAVAWIAAAALSHVLPGPSAATEMRDDVRILVDVSGSMKENDPRNLRRPALRLITGLLPEDSQAGIWLFGRYVNMIVPPGPVDKQWQREARKAADEIHSHGLYTNLAGVLEDATWDWRDAEPQARRNVILLSDGLVDMPGDQAEDRAIRSRILEELLPRFQDAGITLHTIALSEGADHSLLEQLAAATEGWYERVDDAERLERIFLKLFQQATQPDTLPLKNNEVQVDESIRELTLVVFHSEDAPAVELMAPGRRHLTRQTLPDNVRWQPEARYDLITVTDPQPGTWQVLTAPDPDNRVMVVTNLKLRATQLPNHLPAGEPQHLVAQLMQRGKLIHQQDFLALVSMDLEQRYGQQDKRWQWSLTDDGADSDIAAEDGLYSLRLTDSLIPGRHELVLQVDGQTFQREQRQVVHVHKHPVVAKIRANPYSQDNEQVLSVIPHGELIDPETLQVEATVQGPQGERRDLAVPRISLSEWQASLAKFNPQVRHQVKVTIEGQRPSGRPISDVVGPLTFGGSEPEPSPEPRSSDRRSSPESESPPEPAAEPQPPADYNPWLVGVAVVAFNVLLALGLLLGWRAWRRLIANPADRLFL